MRAGELSPEDRANILNLRHGPVLPPLSADAQVFDERAEATLSRMLGPILGSVEVGDERPNSVAALASSLQTQTDTPAPRATPSVRSPSLSGAQVGRSTLANQGPSSPSLSFNLAGGVTPRSRVPEGDGFVSSMRLDAGSINLDAFIMMFLAKYLEDSNEHRAAMRKLSRLEGELQLGFKDLEIAMTKVQQRYELMTAYMKTAKGTLDTVKSAAQSGHLRLVASSTWTRKSPMRPAISKRLLTSVKIEPSNGKHLDTSRPRVDARRVGARGAKDAGNLGSRLGGW